MDPGSKVTFNGVRSAGWPTSPRSSATAAGGEVHLGRVSEVHPADSGQRGRRNRGDHGVRRQVCVADLAEKPDAATDHQPDVIDARSVTTEINTLFQTLTSIAEKVDPVKLNLTLSAARDALTRLGRQVRRVDRQRQHHPRQRQSADADRSATTLSGWPSLGTPTPTRRRTCSNFLNNAVTTAHTLTDQQKDLDAGVAGGDRLRQYRRRHLQPRCALLVRGAADLVPTPSCSTPTARSFSAPSATHDAAPQVAAQAAMATRRTQGPAALSGRTHGNLAMGILPPARPTGTRRTGRRGAESRMSTRTICRRVNARGGPGGAPGCWQKITRDLWPAPYLVMDTGVSVAPYNHVEIGSPWAIEYVWGRQMGENTINP